uniref:ADAM metallopeptidase with thrombospondin type 1 motif 12 n=1 Tax=Lepisosteus oculatus TaxID=7918 RepID=W5N3H7_LEPOC|nr:PREDICTED: A disintegrin and metalloproteinase with thrombospondin motifs 12 [Lepisosteus oculatus]
MLCLQESRILFLLQFVFFLAVSHARSPQLGNFYFPDKEQEQFLRSQTEFALVHPQKVGRDGEFVSHNLAHHIKLRSKRDVEVAEHRVFYKLNHNGQDIIFDLTINHHLLSREYFLEWRSGSPNATKMHSSTLNSCHFIGTVENSSSVAGVAAISTCNGLRGFFSLPEGSYFIEPVREHEPEEGEQQPHVIYQSSFPQQPQRQRRSAELHHGRMPCGLKDSYLDSLRTERRRENWERKHSKEGRQIAQRSVSKERWVETLVVADPKMIEYHGIENVESYVFTIMNMVTGIFHDASIGNAIHIVLVRLILLQEEEKGLKIVHHADNTLASFCTWQKSINPQSDTHPAHHDVAVLITRKDICAGMNKPCETLGLSHLSGMCQAHRSCNINEDSGLPVAFTVAHELGHSFGIHHDGQGNDCEQGRHPFIMSRQLQYDASPLTWSTCSKDYITRFLDRGWGSCLDDRPSKKDLTAPAAAPGVLYTIHQQCQLQYGPSATFCEEVENVCQTLWCSVNGSCRSKLDSPADGTRCGEDKWCISGECVIVGKLPETVNGGWGVWSHWSHCTRTCGAGVQSAERECNNPKPEYGGKYCTGERKRYRICNTKACPKDRPTFREMQCSEFDTVPYKNELYEWIPVANLVNPCELNCRPVDEQFSEKMLDAVTDGTPCFMNNSSRNICINGVCKAVGCDYAIDSNAVEDRCGICLGDGSSCHTVRKTFVAKEGSGYVDVGMIPEGARDIVVKEVEEAGNFLVLRSEDPEKYYLNGNFIIQWNGEYLAGGTTFYYERKGNLENLTSPGPTREPVWLQLLFQEQNPGIEYEYTIRNSRVKGNDISVLEYKWKYGAWTDCSATCGTGFQRQPVRCFETETGVVEETLCDPDTRPLDRQRKCKTMDCPARWWVGSWQLCSATCGPSGVKKRTVLCVRTVGEEERVLPFTECKHLLKPKSLVPCNREVLCGSEWAVGNWSKCSVSCGGGVRSRSVSCVAVATEKCDPSKKPHSKLLCSLQSCPSSRRTFPPSFLKFRKIFTKSSPNNGTLKPSSTTLQPDPMTTTPTSTWTTTAMTITSPSVVTSVLSLSTWANPIAEDTVDSEDYYFNFIVVKNGSTKGIPKISRDSITNRKDPEPNNGLDEDHGSTPDIIFADKHVRYTPGYDYVTDDSTLTRKEANEGSPHKGINSSRDLYRTTAPTPYTSQSPLARTTLPYHRTVSTGKTHIKPSNKWLTRTRTATMSPIRYKTKLTTPTTSWMPHSETEKIHTAVTVYPTIKVLKEHFKKVSDPWATRNATAAPEVYGSRDGHFLSFTGNYENIHGKPHISRNAHWVIGNWSECSTTCGLGAVWRTVVCSTNKDSDCENIKRPDPARRCHLRPCAAWKSGEWSKCSEGCTEATKVRDVQCIDTQSKRQLRPFHCQALAFKPSVSAPCNHQRCLEWRLSPWSKCSKSCGPGLRERLVYCPEYNRCNLKERPSSTEPCSERLCTKWVADAWEECTVTCGGGVQHRVVNCVNEETKNVENNSLCEKTTRPDSFQKCHLQECEKSKELSCSKNHMSTRFCEKLKLLGRCSVSSIRKQCCSTCAA